MKVLIVNTYDKWGAANSCIRLHKSLLKSGMDSSLLLRNKEKKLPFTEVVGTREKVISKRQKLKVKFKRILEEIQVLKEKPVSKNEIFFKNRPKGLEAFSFPESQFDITMANSYNEADIVNLHWVANFLDYSSFFKINKKPVVWTLHDMNPFTGGAHYNEEYLGIDEFGNPVERKVSEEELRISKINIEIKIQALSKVDNLTIVTPSKWLANEARKSEVFNSYPIYCIPNGLDSEVYKPRDKNYSRELLNIPKDKKVILFVADSIDNNRKGFIFLKKALEQLSNANLFVCAIGNKNSNFLTNDNIMELGVISDERLMSVAYSAADIFIIPSLIDNLPNTVLESLMCGTPVIGFPVGGIPDMIQNGVNGYLTEQIGVNSLVESINKFLSNSDYFDRGEIRKDALLKYDQKVQSRSYIDLFTKILENLNE